MPLIKQCKNKILSENNVFNYFCERNCEFYLLGDVAIFDNVNIEFKWDPTPQDMTVWRYSKFGVRYSLNKGYPKPIEDKFPGMPGYLNGVVYRSKQTKFIQGSSPRNRILKINVWIKFCGYNQLKAFNFPNFLDNCYLSLILSKYIIYCYY